MKVAINGFGRIGRSFLKVAIERSEIDVVAINDLGDIENLAYLLAYDTVYGKSDFNIETKDGLLVVQNKEIKFLSEKDPTKLPWKELDIDVVVEATGFFSRYEQAQMHQKAGAKKVVITAPAKDAENEGVLGNTVLIGVNEEKFKTCTISSNGSCTTNAGSPVVAIMNETLGVEKALLNTVHGYTATQALVDSPNKRDFRRGRAAAQNIIPASTGAAIAVTKALPELEGKFDGIALRVPLVAGSIADITFISKRDTTKDEVNNIFKKAAKEKRWSGIFTVTDEPLVSSDILGNPHAAIVDLSMTRVADGNLVKVLSWYDNEMGYAYTLVEHVIRAGQAL